MKLQTKKLLVINEPTKVSLNAKIASRIDDIAYLQEEAEKSIGCKVLKSMRICFTPSASEKNCSLREILKYRGSRKGTYERLKV